MSQPPLTPETRERLAALLHARRAALRAGVRDQMLGSGDERAVGLAHRISETDDWAAADAAAELDIAEVRHAMAELADVESAIARLNAGSYGECVDCGEPIAPARLAAYPAAMRCFACQESYERKRAGPPVTAR